MKGTKTIEINGKEVELKFTLGAIEDFEEETGIGLDGIDEALTKTSNIITFIHVLSNKELTREEIRDVPLNELEGMFSAIQESKVEGLGKGKAKVKKAKK